MDTDPSKCATEPNSNLVGFNIATAPSAKNIDACCQACQTNIKCSYWTLVNQTCLLKSSDAGRVKQAGAVSGGNAPPPPPSGTSTQISAWATIASEGEEVAVFLSFWSNTTTEAKRTVAVASIVGREQLASGASGTSGIVTEYRIDATHANAYPVWQALGSPPKPSAAVLKQMMAASMVVPKVVEMETDGSVVVEMLPNSAVVLVYSS